MDEFSVCLSGTEMKLDEISALLRQLVLRASHRKGTLSATRTGHIYPDTSCHFEAPDWTLKELLQYLVNAASTLTAAGVEEFEVWAFMPRSGQINGEIRSDEVELVQTQCILHVVGFLRG